MPVALGVNGGVLGSNNLPTATTFRGVFTPNEVARAIALGFWPINKSQAVTGVAGSGALGTLTVGSNADPYFNLTTLLLSTTATNGQQNNTFQDSSTNNFTITRNPATGPNAPTQGTFSPFSQTGWGNYFSANTSELSFASNAAFNLSGVSWTIEFWTYPTENAPARDRNWITRRQASGAFTSSYQIYCGSGANTLKFLVTGQTVVTSTSSLTPNQWNHVAVVWNGTTLYFYINGVQDATTGTYGAGTGADAEPLRIGRLATNDNVLSYMSNVRVVKGVAVYTGNFTVPSTPLAITQSSGTNISAITGTQTSLLTCQTNRFVDVTANAFVPTVGTGTSVQAFSPFNPTASWSAATNGGSGYFDGNGDYLTLLANSAFAIGTGNFTFDCWLYPLASNSGLFTMTASGVNDLVISNNWNPNTGSTTSGTASVTFGATTITAPTNAVIQNAWNHIAVVRSSGSVRVYVNGSGGTQTANTSNVSGSYAPAIGALYTHSASATPACYMFNMRLVKGTAVYDPSQSTITVPTSPLTAITNTSLLLNFTNAGIYDATAKNVLETVGTAQASTTQAKFGTTSMYFDGTTTPEDLLSTPVLPYSRIGAGDYTLEMWIRPSRVNTLQALLSYGSSAFRIFLNSSNIWFLNSGTSIVQYNSVVTTANQWYYLVLVRKGSSGTNCAIFLDGTRLSTGFANTTDFSTGTPNIGGEGASNLYQGYMQDFRLTRFARYDPASSTITVPTEAFPVQ